MFSYIKPRRLEFFRTPKFYITNHANHLVTLAYFLAFLFAAKAQFLLQKPVRISPLCAITGATKSLPKGIGIKD